MSDYYDADDRSLGHWERCTEADYERELDQASDAGDLTVFASRTEVGEQQSDGTYRSRFMYTEWGLRGSPTPLVACEDRWDAWGEREHTHQRFVTRPAAAS